MDRIYIQGMSAISPQDTFQRSDLPSQPVNFENNLLRCIEPNYSSYINPVMARRMSRIIKMGITVASECLADAGISSPDGIITGTALGCLEDTEKFLMALIQDDEQYLTPTHFIQSIQNAVGAQIALHLKCKQHNFTFVHKGFSFGSALLDAIMLIRDQDAANVLVGGLDEMTDLNFQFYCQLGLIKKNFVSTDSLLKDPSPGTIGGEGVTFFLLGTTCNSACPVILQDIQLHYSVGKNLTIAPLITQFLLRNHLVINDLSLVMLGLNGDQLNDGVYTQLMNGILKHLPKAWYKHLCGEYQTSSAFAMWVGAQVLKNEHLPNYISLGEERPLTYKHILIVTNYDNNYSLILLSRN